MLEVTDATASFFKSLLDRDGHAARGIRIEPGHNTHGDALIVFRPVTGPHDGDVKTLAKDLDVFVASEVADTLASSVLDVEAPGQSGTLVLRAQAEVV